METINNYFKVGKNEFFFFNDQSNRSTNEAFEAAVRVLRSFPDSRLSIYRQIHAELTMFIIGESPEISPFQEVETWTATGWTLRAKDIGQGVQTRQFQIEEVT